MSEMARKPNGHDERDRVVDLRRYRQSAERARKAPPPPRGRSPGPAEPFLGPRRNAGVILFIVVLVMILLTLGPGLLRAFA